MWNCSSHVPSSELECFDEFARLCAVSLLIKNLREKFDIAVSCLKNGHMMSLMLVAACGFAAHRSNNCSSFLAAPPVGILQQKRDCSQSMLR